MLGAKENGPYVTHITTGKIVDMGISDANNMGAAMAPAAVDTITTHFEDTGLDPSYYDLIVTATSPPSARTSRATSSVRRAST